MAYAIGVPPRDRSVVESAQEFWAGVWMDRQRRRVVKAGGGVAVWAMLVASGLVAPEIARAARDTAVFDATSLEDALRALGAQTASEHGGIRIDAPDVAEDGRVVPLGVVSSIAQTEQIVIVIEENPYKVAASFEISAEMVAEVHTRVKMSRSSTVHALVKADGKFFVARRDVRVTVGGCGV